MPKTEILEDEIQPYEEEIQKYYNEEEEEEEEEPEIQPVKIKKQRKPLTDKQIESLKLGRLRAKEIRDQMKKNNEFLSKTEMEKKMRELKAIERMNELKKLKQEVDEKEEALKQQEPEPETQPQPPEPEPPKPKNEIEPKPKKKIVKKIIKYVQESDSDSDSDSDDSDKMFIKKRGKKKNTVINSLEQLLREY